MASLSFILQIDASYQEVIKERAQNESRAGINDSSNNCNANMTQNMAVLESTHRQFELAVQEAELVLPESSDGQMHLFSPHSNQILQAAKIHNSGDQNIHCKPRSSFTRSEIESDSGVESINSDLQRHHLQNSPVYSPVGTYANPPSSSSSSYHIPETIQNRTENSITEKHFSTSQPNQKPITASESLVPSSLVPTMDLQAINDIESNFPDVFGHASDCQLQSFSDLIEAETLQLFGTVDPTNTPTNHIPSVNSTKSSTSGPLPQKSNNQEASIQSIDEAYPNMSITNDMEIVVSEGQLNNPTIIENTSLQSITKANSSENSNEEQELVSYNDFYKDLQSSQTQAEENINENSSKLHMTSKITPLKRKATNKECLDKSKNKKAKINDSGFVKTKCNLKDENNISSVGMQSLKESFISNRLKKDTETRMEKDKTESSKSLGDIENTVETVSAFELEGNFHNRVIGEKDNSSKECCLKPNTEKLHHNSTDVNKLRKYKPGPKSRKRRLSDKLDEGNSSTNRDVNPKVDLLGTIRRKYPVNRNATNKCNEPENVIEADLQQEYSPLVNKERTKDKDANKIEVKLNKDVSAQYHKQIIYEMGAHEINGDEFKKPTLIIESNDCSEDYEMCKDRDSSPSKRVSAEEERTSPLKSNEIESNLQTCIEACLPALTLSKQGNNRSETGSLPRNEFDKSSLSGSSISERKDGKNYIFKSSKVKMASNEVDITEKVKQFSLQLKALRKVHEKENTKASHSHKDAKVMSTDAVYSNGFSDKESKPNVIPYQPATSLAKPSTSPVPKQGQTNGPYECSKCGRKYQYENFLKVHIKRC